MRKQLIKVYVEEQTKAKLEDRAGRESLSSFVSGLIDSYLAEYPGLSKSQVKRIEAQMPKDGDTVTIKKPARFVPVNYDVTVEVGPTPNATRAQYEKAAKHLADRIDTSLCQHNMMKGACPRCK